MTWLLLGLLLGVLAAGWFGYERQAAVYDQLVRTVETQRDQAQNEMKVFRGLLFPVINRAAEAASEGAVRGAATHPPSPLVPSSKIAAPAPSHIASRRLPFRMRFNQARKAMNQPQIKHDALADALAKQKTSATQKAQEKKENVSA